MDSKELLSPLFFGHPYYSALAIPQQFSGRHEIIVKYEEGNKQDHFEIGMSIVNRIAILKRMKC